MIKLGELRSKDQSQLQQLLAAKAAELADALSQSGGEEVKNVRALRVLKKDVARIKTLLREQVLAAEEKN